MLHRPPHLTGNLAALQVLTSAQTEKERLEVFGKFAGGVSNGIVAFLKVSTALLSAYVKSLPTETWDIEEVEQDE
jgi:hypothetical protein